MRKSIVTTFVSRGAGVAIACAAICLLCTNGLTWAQSQRATMTYASMAPAEGYLMDRDEEIALARSAAPKSVSQDATVLVLGRQGYQTAVEGKNGFVCMVERGWNAAFDWPEFWNPKIRGADCLNPPAARALLPLVKLRAELVMAGRSQEEIIAGVKSALAARQMPALGSGAMAYMMARGSYLTDAGEHNGPHLMFFIPVSQAATWGADLPGSPVMSSSYWFFSPKAGGNTDGLPPLRVFIVGVGWWSDGATAPPHSLHHELP